MDTSSAIAPDTSSSRKKSEYLTAWMVYALIFVTFFGICFTAVILTNQREAAKTGFRAIETEKPMSFIDDTYVKKPAQKH